MNVLSRLHGNCFGPTGIGESVGAPLVTVEALAERAFVLKNQWLRRVWDGQRWACSRVTLGLAPSLFRVLLVGLPQHKP